MKGNPGVPRMNYKPLHAGLPYGNNTAYLPYGNGCSKFHNCFSCIKRDCRYNGSGLARVIDYRIHEED